MIDRRLDSRRFIANEFRPNIEYYQSIATRQTPQGALDPPLRFPCQRSPDDRLEARHDVRVPQRREHHSFSDVNIPSILEYGVVHLQIEDIIVCGHTRCGGVAAIEDEAHENSIADWLCIASGAEVVADRVAAERGLSREQKLKLLTEENVKLRIKHLKNLAVIKNQHAKGCLPRIHGWLDRVETGTVDVLVDGRNPTA